MNNRKAKLLFIEKYQPFRISNRKWLAIFNRSGDMALYKSRRRSKKLRRNDDRKRTN